MQTIAYDDIYRDVHKRDEDNQTLLQPRPTHPLQREQRDQCKLIMTFISSSTFLKKYVYSFLDSEMIIFPERLLLRLQRKFVQHQQFGRKKYLCFWGEYFGMSICLFGAMDGNGSLFPVGRVFTVRP